MRKPTGFTIPDPVSVEEHGRTFNAYREGKYFLPNDALEQERLDLAHEMWRLLLFGDLAWVPFSDEPRQVLDIGTGTGIWAIEFAQQHPASHVIGTDISLIQPPEGNIPANCTFERDDVEEEWVFDRLFDYVHLRAMLTCFNDHVGVIQRIYHNMRPGGWVEYHDYDPEVFGKDEANQQDLLTAPIWDWSQRVFKGAAKFGRDMMVARRYKKLLMDAGFVDVTEKIVLAPNKPWSDDPRERRIGQYMQANSIEMIGGVSAKLLQASGMSLEESEDLINRCRECFQSKELHLYSRMYVVYGRKPSEGDVSLKTEAQKVPETRTVAVPEARPQPLYRDNKPVGVESAVMETPSEITIAAATQSGTDMIDQSAQPDVAGSTCREAPATETTKETIQPVSEIAKDDMVPRLHLRHFLEVSTASRPQSDRDPNVQTVVAAGDGAKSTIGELSQINMEPASDSVHVAESTRQVPAHPLTTEAAAEASSQTTIDLATKPVPFTTEDYHIVDSMEIRTVPPVAEPKKDAEEEIYPEKMVPRESRVLLECEKDTSMDPVTDDCHEAIGDLAAAYSTLQVDGLSRDALTLKRKEEPEVGGLREESIMPSTGTQLAPATSKVDDENTKEGTVCEDKWSETSHKVDPKAEGALSPRPTIS